MRTDIKKHVWKGLTIETWYNDGSLSPFPWAAWIDGKGAIGYGEGEKEAFKMAKEKINQ